MRTSHCRNGGADFFRWNRPDAQPPISALRTSVGKGKNNITKIAIGTCPKTIAETDITLSSKFFTMTFQMAWANAANITAIKIIDDINRLVSN